MRVDGLSVRVGSQTLLEEISLSVAEGELVALTGPSGSGKTVLARTLLGVFDGRPGTVSGQVDSRGAAWLPQHGLASLDPLRRVRELADPESLEIVALGDAGPLFPHQLSGGMAKRVALARALTARRPFLIADEPASGVDADLRVQLQQQLRDLADEGFGILWITHDLDAAARLAHRCLAMDRGRLVPFEPPNPSPLTPPRPDLGETVLEIDDLHFAYRQWGRSTPVLRGVSIRVRAGERVALVGPSGSGKSTLAELVVGLRQPDSGRVQLCRRPPAPGRDSQLLTQDPRAMLVEDLPLDALLTRSARLHGRSEADVSAILEAVALSHRRGARPDELSGGELRRAGIARVCLARPALLVADEPLSALDTPLRAAMVRVLFDALGTEGSLLFITHDLELARVVAHTVVTLDEGRTS